MTTRVVFLCGDDELDKERRGFARAFARHAELSFVPPSRGDAWLGEVRALRPHLVLNPDGRPWLPRGIETLDATTACFQIDTFTGLEARIRWSAMYDYVLVFHPGFESRFDHPGARLLPHAADRELLEGDDPPREYDVGWVGHTGRAIYRQRDAVLAELAPRFRMNDPSRWYTAEEMAAIYRASKIVVNVSRDDYPIDANMRCFEAMASGALLITGMPTELTALGFDEGVHFIGFTTTTAIPSLVEQWLGDDTRREAIAARARALVGRVHTYDARVDAILTAIESGARAPARSMPPARARQCHFEYGVEHADVRGSLRALRDVAKASPMAALASASRLARLAAKVARKALR